MTRRIKPVLPRVHGGWSVQVSSIPGRPRQPYPGAYNAGRYTPKALTGTLRMTLRRNGIRVSRIEPGARHTRFRDKAR